MKKHRAGRRARRRLGVVVASGWAALRMAAAPVTLYVSPGGDDQATGRSEEAAFRTLGRARDESRNLRQEGHAPQGVTVAVAPGVYTLTAPLVFGQEDAGTEEAPLVFTRGATARPSCAEGLP